MYTVRTKIKDKRKFRENQHIKQKVISNSLTDNQQKYQ